MGCLQKIRLRFENKDKFDINMDRRPNKNFYLSFFCQKKNEEINAWTHKFSCGVLIKTPRHECFKLCDSTRRKMASIYTFELLILSGVFQYFSRCYLESRNVVRHHELFKLMEVRLISSVLNN